MFCREPRRVSLEIGETSARPQSNVCAVEIEHIPWQRGFAEECGSRQQPGLCVEGRRRNDLLWDEAYPDDAKRHEHALAVVQALRQEQRQPGAHVEMQFLRSLQVRDDL